MPTVRRIRHTTKLHSVQSAFRHSPALFRAFVGGRGAGKSFVGAYDLIARAKPDHTYLVGSPTGVLMGDTTFPRFEKIAKGLNLWVGVRLTPYPNVYLRAGKGIATVRFRTAEDPERMRGPDLSGVWLDEASLMVEDAYKICLGSLREAGEQGWLTATFTPSGPTHWTHAVFNTKRPNTALFTAATSANPFLPPDFQATLQEQYGNTPFARQELEGLFVQPEGAFFPADWLDWPGFYVDAFPDAGVARTLLYLDPSQGKDAKKGDDQAYVLAGWWPGPRNENLMYLECIATKEDVVAMVGRGVRLCRDRAVTHWHYETNGTMGFLSAEVRRQLKDATMPHVRPCGFDNTENKQLRIRNAFLPYLKNRQLRIVDTPGGRLLAAQLGDCPYASHDDCSDAGAGAVTELEKLIFRG